MAEFAGRAGIVQRVLPRYRAPFFDMLARHCEGGLGVFAGEPRLSEAIRQAERLSVAQWTHAHNRHLFGGKFYLLRQPGLVRWLEQWNPDALVVEANPRYLSTPAAVRWMKARQRPVIGWGLGAPTAQSPLAPARSQRRLAFLRQFDALIAYSSQGAQEYAALGFDARKVFIAPNAVSPRPGSSPEREEGKEKLTVLYVGRLQARKRLDALILACANLPANLQPQLVIVGDGPERASLETLARQLYPSTQFRGALFGEQLDSVFDEADFFVLPGTGGLAVQQAMAHALPVMVAEGDGSQRDLVTPASGWRLPPSDDAALRSAIQNALSDPTALRSKGRESFRLVQEKFNLENMVAAFVDALNKVTG